MRKSTVIFLEVENPLQFSKLQIHQTLVTSQTFPPFFAVDPGFSHLTPLQVLQCGIGLRPELNETLNRRPLLLFGRCAMDRETDATSQLGISTPT